MATDTTLNTANTEGSEIMLSRNPNKALQEVVTIIAQLHAVYEEENAVLASSDTKRFMAMQERKIQAIRNYQSAVGQISSRHEEFKAADPKLKQKIKTSYEDFVTLTATNMKSLDRMRKAVNRLSDRILRSAREAVRKDTLNYGASGNLKTNTRAVSFNLNQSA